MQAYLHLQTSPIYTKINTMNLKEISSRIINDIKNSIWIIIGIFAYWAISFTVFDEFCPMKILTGIPCPGCGMTRAIFLMLTGHFSESFEMHPMALLWILLGLYFFICRYILDRKPKGAATMAVVLCVMMFPIYIYRMCTLFPDYPPMVYTQTPLGDMLIELLRSKK